MVVENDEMMALIMSERFGVVLQEMYNLMKEKDKKTHQITFEFNDVRFTLNGELLGDD